MSNAGGGSYNVAGSGNFSIQVLESALYNHSGQKLVNITKLTQSDFATTCQGFICHKGDHWIAIRRVHDVWYNLNSTNTVPPGPQYISNFQLDAFLSSIKDSGFHIFSVQGGDAPLPLPNPASNPVRRPDSQMYVSADEVYLHW
jgi:hypothetical protein